MEFTEVSASNPHQLIHLHVLISKKDIDVPLYTSKEIIDYRWFTLKDDIYILSPSIRNHLIDYAKENNLL